jgi:hypothetical protein
MSRPGLTVPQVAMACGVDQITVRSWIRRRRVVRDCHGHITIPSLLAYLDERGDRGQRWDARLARLARSTSRS